MAIFKFYKNNQLKSLTLNNYFNKTFVFIFLM